MNDLLLRLADIAAILKKDLSKKDKVVLSFQRLSGLDITTMSNATKKLINQHIIEANAIIMKYPIKTFDDYAMLSDHHLNKLLKSIKQLCKHVRMSV